jgi:hypothetical protein
MCNYPGPLAPADLVDGAHASRVNRLPQPGQTPDPTAAAKINHWQPICLASKMRMPCPGDQIDFLPARPSYGLLDQRIIAFTRSATEAAVDDASPALHPTARYPTARALLMPFSR